MAAGVLVAAHRRGIAVPATLSVAGFDDAPLAQLVWPPLTTTDAPSSLTIILRRPSPAATAITATTEAMAPARIRIGGGTFLNLAVQVAAVELVEIGEHCMFANGCFVTDGNHRFDDPDKPVPWQGFTSKGPTRIGDNVWCGANVVITSGVTIGERCVIGANSVVTTDLPPYSIAAGAPAKVLRQVTYP